MQPLGKYKPSVIALVAANFVPLVGVLFLGWSVFAIMAIYWAENVIVGAINVLKMITCSPDPNEIIGAHTRDSQTIADIAQVSRIHQLSKLFFIPFFTVHYGIFCLVHGIFVLVLFGGGGPFGGAPGDVDISIEQLVTQILRGGMALAVLALAASHLFSFFKNYLLGGEYRRTLLPQLMFQPYGRVVVMHVAILFGGVATALLGRPEFALLILIAGKTVIDIKLHLRQRRHSVAEASELGQIETA